MATQYIKAELLDEQGNVIRELPHGEGWKIDGENLTFRANLNNRIKFTAMEKKAEHESEA